MKRGVAVLLAGVVLASAGAGAGAWLLVRDSIPRRPEISAYSHGYLTRVGPYVYCNVLDLTDCQTPQAEGELPVNAHDPVQLSVPTAIGRAPWQLLRWYEDGATAAAFRPGSRLAVTIPTVDPYRGRLTGIAVQLMTVDSALGFVPHAEWSVRMQWA